MPILARCLALVVLLAVPGVPAAAGDVEDCLQEAPASKIAGCTRVIERGGDAGLRLAAAYHQRGIAHHAQGDLDLAIVDYSEVLRLERRHYRALNNRGWAYNEKHDYDRAFADLNKAIRLQPKRALAYNNRGNTHLGKRDLDRAIADYDQAIRLDPTFAMAYSNRSATRRRKGELDKALADSNEAIRLNPALARAYMNRAEAYWAKKEGQKALPDYRKVLELPAVAANDRLRQEAARERIASLTRPRSLSPRRVALVIGNAGYAHVGALANPGNDARAVAAVLRKLGFALVMEHYDLGREAMGRALKDFGDEAAGAEWAVVFFAGHGVELNGTNYLIPTDAELKRDTHVIDETISLDRVQAKVDQASKLGLVILDACRNNPFMKRMVRTLGKRSVGRGLASIEPEGNVLVAYAAKHGTEAEDGAQTHSPFTEALLAHIAEPGLEINILFRKVRDAVRSRTQRRQDPFVYGSLGSELLYFKPPVAAR
jgi:tetratricopeptide (TPR) repeat protein